MRRTRGQSKADVVQLGLWIHCRLHPLGGIQRLMGYQRRRSNDHKKQATWFNERAIAAAAFIVKNFVHGFSVTQSSDEWHRVDTHLIEN
jgi:hypothetical protein